MIKESFNPEALTMLNTCSSNNRAWKYMKKKPDRIDRTETNPQL